VSREAFLPTFVAGRQKWVAEGIENYKNPNVEILKFLYNIKLHYYLNTIPLMEQKSEIIQKVASTLHEEWRKNRLQSD
jgi:hypothetical protein